MDSKLHFSSSNSQKTIKTYFLEIRFCKRLPGRSQPELLRRFSKPFGSLSRFVVCKFELRGVISYQSIEITGEIRSFDAWIFSESTFSSRSNSVDLIHIIQFSAKITRENCPIGLFPVDFVVQSWSRLPKTTTRVLLRLTKNKPCSTSRWFGRFSQVKTLSKQSTNQQFSGVSIRRNDWCWERLSPDRKNWQISVPTWVLGVLRNLLEYFSRSGIDAACTLERGLFYGSIQCILLWLY